MDNKLYYFLIPFGLVVIIADAVLFYQIIGLIAVYLSVFFILVILIGYFFYFGINKKSVSNLKRQQIVSIKPVDSKKVLFYKKILIVEIVLIILLMARILILTIN